MGRRSNVDIWREKSAQEIGKDKRREALKGLRGLMELILGGFPLPTQYKFILDDVEEQKDRLVRVKGYMGPLGCAKTATLCCAGLIRALMMPGSRLLVCRLTYGELETTTQSRFLECVRRLPKGVVLDYNKSPPATLYLAPAIPGATEHSEVLFHSLDDPQKLASVEVTDAIIDEASEISSDVVHKVETRLGRRQAGSPNGPFFLMMAFNPPSTAHWIYQESAGQPENPYIKLYRPQPDENKLNLPRGYYQSLSKTLSPEMRKRLIEGEWGADFGGKAVYPEFVYSYHVQSDLAYIPEEPVFRFWDFGYNNPVCLIVQRSYDGRLKVLHEIDGKREEIEPFVARVNQTMAGLHIPEPDYEAGGGDYGDPAAYQHKDTGQTSSRLSRLGVQLVGIHSKIDDGLAVVRGLLARKTEDGAALVIHPRCGRLIEALMGGYRYKETRELQMPRLVPWKDDFYDHCCDALRYGCLCLNLGQAAPLTMKDIDDMYKQTSVLEDDDTGEYIGKGEEDHAGWTNPGNRSPGVW